MHWKVSVCMRMVFAKNQRQDSVEVKPARKPDSIYSFAFRYVISALKNHFGKTAELGKERFKFDSLFHNLRNNT